MPSQTPMEKAQSVYNGTIERGRSVTIGQFAKSQDCALEEAITAYLAALPEDKETVERVARGIDENAFLVPSYQDPRNREVNIQRRKTAMRQALRAITALTATGR